MVWMLLLFATMGTARTAVGQDSNPDKDAAAAADPPRKTERLYARLQDHDPDGTGKIYMGREIARVMTYHGAAWLEREEREEEERLSLLIRALDLRPGMVVADIGAGSGIISLLMAEQVAPDGTVLAVDIQKQMLSLISKKLREYKIENVKPVLGTKKSPKLEPASVDLALFVDVYHEFEFPYEMMLEISKSMKPGGRVVLVEYRKEDPGVPIKLVHKMTQEQVKIELGHAEFRLRWKETLDVLPRQHILVFERVEAAEQPSP